MQNIRKKIYPLLILSVILFSKVTLATEPKHRIVTECNASAKECEAAARIAKVWAEFTRNILAGNKPAALNSFHERSKSIYKKALEQEPVKLLFLDKNTLFAVGDVDIKSGLSQAFFVIGDQPNADIHQITFCLGKENELDWKICTL